MGYSTEFTGEFKINKSLDKETKKYLIKFSETRRMARNLGHEYGVEGEFYVGGKGDFGQDRDETIIDYNKPAKTQPGLWCQWIPNEDGTAIIWNGAEKFYNYFEWIKYLINNFLAPKNYILNGEVEFQGEDENDCGVISIRDNKVLIC